MIVFKDAEKHEPKSNGIHLCITREGGKLSYEEVEWSGVWRKYSFIKILAFSETPPETALKGISEDPEETVYK